jgi:hypothetical protein
MFKISSSANKVPAGEAGNGSEKPKLAVVASPIKMIVIKLQKRSIGGPPLKFGTLRASLVPGPRRRGAG